MHCRLVLLATLAVASLVVGCSRGGKFTLQQPFAPPAQRELELKGHWMYFASDEGRWRGVLAFPLPGSTQGERAFVAYLSMPEAPETVTVGPDPEDMQAFLVQEVGRLSGKTLFDRGSVTVRKVPLKPMFRRLTLTLESSDGTTLEGKAIVQSSPTDVRAFERQYDADVQRLRNDSDPDAEPRTTSPTSSRPAAP